MYVCIVEISKLILEAFAYETKQTDRSGSACSDASLKSPNWFGLNSITCKIDPDVLYIWQMCLVVSYSVCSGEWWRVFEKYVCVVCRALSIVYVPVNFVDLFFFSYFHILYYILYYDFYSTLQSKFSRYLYLFCVESIQINIYCFT